MTHEPPGDPLADYRPVSPLAVGALVAGCCSAVALVTRFAWVVPLLGVALAVAALVDIARPDVRKAGRLAALAGLALAVGFGMQAVTGSLVDRWILGRRARAAAEAWIDAVRGGRTAEALGLCSPSVLPPSTLPLGLDHQEGEAERLERFGELPAVKAVAGCDAASPVITRAAPAGTDDGGWTLAADLTPCGAPATTLSLAVAPRRVRGTAGAVERWTIVVVAIDR